MRNIFFIGIIIIFFTACEKDKFTTAPQIKFSSLKPNVAVKGIFSNGNVPIITVSITDAEGDLGIKPNVDTAFVFIKNLLTGNLDSLIMPDLKSSAKKDFKADIEISTVTVLNNNGGPGPKTDSLYFEVYVKDFEKNKSNVITTPEPVLYFTP